MARWADRDEQRNRRPGRTSGPALRASALAIPLLLLLATAVPVQGQRSSTGRALIEVPPISEIDVTSHAAQESETGEETGVFRIRVRANHAWKVVLAAPVAGQDGVWIRVADDGGAEYRRLEPGQETVVASGDRGEATVELAYRWHPSSEVASSPPLVYTLGSL